MRKESPIVDPIRYLQKQEAKGRDVKKLSHQEPRFQ